MKTIHFFFFVSVLLLISACGASSSTSAPTVEVGSISTSTQLPIAASTLTPIPTDAPTSAPLNFSPILYGGNFDKTSFILLGGAQGAVWLSPDITVTRFAGPLEYDIHPFPNGNIQMAGNAPEFSPTCKSYFVGTDATIEGAGMVGVAQGWQVLQRDVEELPADNEFYEQAVIDWLTAEGISAPELDVLRVFCVDIEGDGVDEIFITATHLDESQHTTKAGDYSIILMRKVAGNEAVTLPIVGDVYHSQEIEITFPPTYSLANFIDLNQDGALEVVVDIQKWEGFGAIVYQVDDQDVIQTLRAVCPP